MVVTFRFSHCDNKLAVACLYSFASFTMNFGRHYYYRCHNKRWRKWIHLFNRRIKWLLCCCCFFLSFSFNSCHPFRCHFYCRCYIMRWCAPFNLHQPIWPTIFFCPNTGWINFYLFFAIRPLILFISGILALDRIFFSFQFHI